MRNLELGIQQYYQPFDTNKGIGNAAESEAREPRPVGEVVVSYLQRAATDQADASIQVSPFTKRPWGEALSQFVPGGLDQRLKEVGKNPDKLLGVVTALSKRGAELVSGGAVSNRDVPENGRRGLSMSGTWPDAPGAHFWDPRERAKEAEVVQALCADVLKLQTTASPEHVGRVVTMALPALISWADLGNGLIPREEMVRTVKRMLDAEKSGSFNTVTFSCEPYAYTYNPQTTTGHLRQSALGTPEELRQDAVQGSMRGARRILEPLVLSGVQPTYTMYTSFGTSQPLIERQVMPDTMLHHRNNGAPRELLDRLDWWKDVIGRTGAQEFAGSGAEFHLKDMERQVIYPALLALHDVLRNCGMEMPDDPDVFAYNSEAWFKGHAHELNYLLVSANHPDPELLAEFMVNEERWSRKHPEAYASQEERVVSAALLSFFELHQYQRISELINNADLALGVEIDEELINNIRNRERQLGKSGSSEQTPLIWGRPPRFTSEGKIGGVAHRQPWIYIEDTPPGASVDIFKA